MELTEKLAYKYLLMSDNDFGRMIEDCVIVNNSQLKIEDINSKQYIVSEALARNKSPTFVDQIMKASQSSIGSGFAGSKGSLLFSQSRLGGNAKEGSPTLGGRGTNQSIKNLIFNVNSEM